MFEIEYKGGNTVVLSTRKSALVSDPKMSLLGLKDIRPKDGVEIATEARLALNDDDARLHIEGPGEYEVGDFSIRGTSASRHIDPPGTPHVATIYRIEFADTRLALLGNIAPKLDEEQLESLGVVDILVIPVGGGGYTLDATSAASIVRQIDPKVVIPVHYADSSLKYEVPQDTLDVFVKELGAPMERVPKFKVKSSSLLPQVLTIVAIERS